MSIESSVNEATDRAIGASISQGERNRQANWSDKRADDESLRSSLESGIEEHFDNPKRRSLDDDVGEYDRLNTTGGIRAMAEAAYEETFVDAAKQERRQHELDQFDLIAKRLKRTHGVDGIEGINQLIAAEESLRKNPAEALGFLYQQYAAGGFGQDVQRIEHGNTMQEVASFFETHEISTEVQGLVLQRLKEPDFKVTGDYEADLKRAYREATQGAKRVRRF